MFSFSHISSPRPVRLAILACALLGACSGSNNDAEATPETAAAPSSEQQGPSAGEAAFEHLAGNASAEQVAAAEQALASELDRDWPLHGLVTGVRVVVHKEPDGDSPPVGWLRAGSRVRLAAEPTRAEGCASGFYRVHPRGYACAGQGITVGDTAPEAPFEVPPPPRDAALPFTYYYVKDPMVPLYHRLPSRDDQRAAAAYSARYLELLGDNERRAERFLAGDLGNEPHKPDVVAHFLDRGFFLASTGVEVRAFRRFVRTMTGGYVKEAHLEQRTGSDWHGMDVDADHPLPMAFTLRAARLLTRQERADGSTRWVNDPDAEVIPRRTVLEHYLGRHRVGDDIMHEVEGERFLQPWTVGVAEAVDPPFEVEDDEPWVHVDLSEQTLVVYRGHAPVYVTLISSGRDGHDTPTGVFEIQKKFISDTMGNLGEDAGDDRYRIEDVPWTQYFDSSVALHGAFWHNGFGLQRSHGCVNLSPTDAHRVWNETWPVIPQGWQGVATDHTGFRASRVVVTD